MACFLVPTAEAIVTTAITKVEEKKEKTEGTEKSESTAVAKVSLVRKLHWLNYLLFGGAILLAFEHVWHGEVVPYFPFLTAAADPADTATMLHEMSTVGVSMALLITAVWVIMCITADVMARRENRRLAAAKVVR
ncbi:MAG: hypothetical protein VZQ80_02570 [Lachnospiraceae bacterium]|nr:hypothetical protein [Lachnospiraceae bacterium]